MIVSGPIVYLMLSAKITVIKNVLQGQRLAAYQVQFFTHIALVAEVIEVNQLTIIALTDFAHCEALTV